MKRLLCIVGGMNIGGAETFLMKIYRKLDRTKYQMDFCVAIKEKGSYDDEIEQLGGKIIHITPKSENIFKNFNEIRKVLKEGKYKSVMRISQHSLSALELFAAKLGGAKKLIFRSSNSNSCGGIKTQIMHYLFRWMAITIPNVKIAPSTEAAEFMFGKKAVKNNRVTILKNAIDLNLFKFDNGAREEKRKELDINDKFVVGHIGRFNQQKNHRYLIDIFKKVKEIKPESILLLIGTGELENEIKQKVINLNLEDSVMFLGIRKDIPELLMAMDVFLFPSFYEGMPNTVIEAQATGLRCVVSDTITKECNITGLVSFISLTESITYWVSEIIKEKHNANNNIKQEFNNTGYNIDMVVREFEQIVFEEGSK